jgi:hypothetical protein
VFVGLNDLINVAHDMAVVILTSTIPVQVIMNVAHNELDACHDWLAMRVSDKENDRSMSGQYQIYHRMRIS